MVDEIANLEYQIARNELQLGYLDKSEEFDKQNAYFSFVYSGGAENEDELKEYNKGITKVVGIESRGFVVGAALAVKLGAGFVMCRKPGKLPASTKKISYKKEYGIDTIEIHTDAIEENDIVLLHDDLLATGGSMKAVKLINKTIFRGKLSTT